MINLNECNFGDKLLMSDGEMGIYAGWYYPPVSIGDSDSSDYSKLSEDKLHNIIIRNGTSFGIAQVYDYGRLHGGIYVVGKWEE